MARVGLTHRAVTAGGVKCHVATHDLRGASNGRATGEECNEEQEGIVARDLGESRNRGGSGSRPQIYEAQGDRERCRRECRQAAIRENGVQGDPGPHAREGSEAAGEARFPLSDSSAL
jgi:hypothetical protein